MKTLSPEDRAEAEAELAAIRRRPAYFAASVMIPRLGAAPAKRGTPVSVGRLCTWLRMTWGLRASPETVAVAAVDLGFRFGMRDFVGYGRREPALGIKSSSIGAAPWRTETPDTDRWEAWSDAPEQAERGSFYRMH